MGISLNSGARAVGSIDGASKCDGVPSYNFYSERSWVEGRAKEQLAELSLLDGVCQIAAFPDLHPGKFGPVGVALLADRVYPQLIGNDIGCGMSLFALDVEVRKLKLEKCAEKFRVLEGAYLNDGPDGLHEINTHLEESNLLELAETHDLFLQSLGTIGGGNHFCELQAIEDVFEADQFDQLKLDKNCALLFVHSGSRGFGMSVFQTVQHCFAEGMKPDSSEFEAYMSLHDAAVRWATLNRLLIAKRAAEALRTKVRLISDNAHNLIERFGDQFLHRKGAAKADLPVVPLAGSRDALSYLLQPTEDIELQHRSLFSLAHGSGRKYDRKSMKGRVGQNKSDLQKLERTSFGGRVVCEDRQLLVEEAPSAYKSSKTVLAELVEADLVTPLLSLKPLLTFKKAQLRSKGDLKKRIKPSRNRRRLR